MIELSQQIEAYDRLRDSLETDHFGKWVVLYDEKLVGTYDSFEEAATDTVSKFGRGPYLIRQVGIGPVSLPASMLYNPVNV